MISKDWTFQSWRYVIFSYEGIDLRTIARHVANINVNVHVIVHTVLSSSEVTLTSMGIIVYKGTAKQDTTTPCADFFISNITNDVFNSSAPEQNGRHFTDDIFKRIFLNEKN